jgi:hypothetical protein
MQSECRKLMVKQKRSDDPMQNVRTIDIESRLRHSCL